jgi:ABC-type lipoprotein release transport system permease subunit
MENTISYIQGYQSGLGVILGFILASNVMIYIEIIKEPIGSKKRQLNLKLKIISICLLVFTFLTSFLLILFQLSLIPINGYSGVPDYLEVPFFWAQWLYIFLILFLLLFNIWITGMIFFAKVPKRTESNLRHSMKLKRIRSTGK